MCGDTTGLQAGFPAILLDGALPDCGRGGVFPLQARPMEGDNCMEMALGLCRLGDVWTENLSLPKKVWAGLHVMTSWREQIS